MPEDGQPQPCQARPRPAWPAVASLGQALADPASQRCRKPAKCLGPGLGSAKPALGSQPAPGACRLAWPRHRMAPLWRCPAALRPRPTPNHLGDFIWTVHGKSVREPTHRGAGRHPHGVAVTKPPQHPGPRRAIRWPLWCRPACPRRRPTWTRAGRCALSAAWHRLCMAAPLLSSAINRGA